MSLVLNKAAGQYGLTVLAVAAKEAAPVAIDSGSIRHISLTP